LSAVSQIQSDRCGLGIISTSRLAKRVREGNRDEGGVAFEFPIHPIQETLGRPTAALDRKLQYLSPVEILYGYPIDGVVLTTGCDKTTPRRSWLRPGRSPGLAIVRKWREGHKR
jgi:dihydroxyacid dehydratase/phosphogluconate dehydratase